MTATPYDVAILCDFRYPGGTSTSIAEEVRAQAAAGLSTVLVHVPSPFNPAVCPFNPHIVSCLRDGAAEMALDGEDVNARLLLIRQPRIFTRDLRSVPTIRAERTMMVINQAPGDLRDAERYYRFAEVRERISGYFGEAIEWAPISPQIRAQVLRVAPDAALWDSDWHEVIDAAKWLVERPEPLGAVPVIGRHGRPDVVKWPTDPAEIKLAYPTTNDVRVRILGGGEIAVKRLGRRPASWEILEFGSQSPRDFLKTIDFFVYFHDPHLVEAFGRTILEAVASGLVAVLPEHFRALFGDAALYTAPAGVHDLVRSLHADWPSYRQVAEQARGVLEERYGHGAHLRRLAQFGVSAAGAVPAPRTGATASTYRPAGVRRDIAARPSARALLVSDNGAGMGHLSRLMALGRRFPPDVKPVIATQSYGVSVAHDHGFLTEYVPSRRHLGLGKRRWDGILRRRLGHLIAIHRPSLVAVDSVPHDGFLDAIGDNRGVVWVSIRRAMWKRGFGTEWVARGAAFDHILEPGEFAAAADDGATVADRHHVHGVAPIVFLDPDELLDGASARRFLGLGDRPAALLQLGAGNINDIASPIVRITEGLVKRGFQVVLAESVIATEPLPPLPGTQVVRLYPLSRYLRGFDLVVSAAGYNSFHELLAFAIPTVLVPTEADLDNQTARARFAAAAGVALTIQDLGDDHLDEMLDQAADPTVRRGLVRRCRQVQFGNGAVEAAGWLASRCLEAAGRLESAGRLEAAGEARGSAARRGD